MEFVGSAELAEDSGRHDDRLRAAAQSAFADKPVVAVDAPELDVQVCYPLVRVAEKRTDARNVGDEVMSIRR